MHWLSERLMHTVGSTCYKCINTCRCTCICILTIFTRAKFNYKANKYNFIVSVGKTACHLHTRMCAVLCLLRYKLCFFVAAQIAQIHGYPSDIVAPVQ